MIDNNIKGNEMEDNFENEFTTDAVLGIMPRNYEDTLVTREIPNNYGYYNEAGEYVENGTFTITHYQYAHNPMDLYRANYRMRYRGGSKPQYGYVRSQYNTLAEYADTFAIYPK
jgi:hypothetical protein